MPTVNDNITAVRLLLDRPDPQRPGLDLLFQLISDQVQHHQNQLQNSSAQWAVDSFPLYTASGQEDYLLSAANFGKPFFVYTEDATDQAFVRHEIPFVMMQNVDQFYRGVRQTQLTDYHTTQFISFYRKDDDAWWARVTPIPSASKQYIIWYETTGDTPLSLGSQKGLTPFNHLIRVQTALAALPHCGWGALTNEALGEAGEAWARKTAALAAARLREEAQYQREFSTYIGTLAQAGIEPRIGFGDDDTQWFANIASW